MRFIVWALMCFIIASCEGNHENYTTRFTDPVTYNRTVKQLNDIVLENNFPPMIAARNYAYANIAAYECMVAGDSSLKTLSGRIQHMPVMPKVKAGLIIDYPLASLLAFVKVGNAVTFPEGSMMKYYEKLLKMADSLNVPRGVLKETITFSDSITAAILKWSKRDNYAATRGAPRFAVNDSAGRWVPTPPMYATGLEPHWMTIRPFALDSASQCMPGRPPVFSLNTNSIYYQALVEVKETVDSLTDEQKHIADFWDDNPFKMNVSGHVMFATKKFSPPGHWMNIVGIAAHNANADFKTTVTAYALTSIALFDGFISCWDEKYRSNYARPETIINEKISGDWHPTSIFGDKMSFTDTSLLEFGIANREIKSFRAAAQEASISRLYGGIHYKFDLDSGNAMGKRVGELIVKKLIK